MVNKTRFQGDTQWQQDFGAMAQAIVDCREHTAAGHQLREADAQEAAWNELELAEAAAELAELYRERLRWPGRI